MARFASVCVVLAEILLVQAMAHGSGMKPETMAQRQPYEAAMATAADQPVSSASESSKVKSEAKGESTSAEAPQIRRLGKHEHHSDKSVAGGGVIIGGLVTAIFAAVFCYIRVTRKRNDLS